MGAAAHERMDGERQVGKRTACDCGAGGHPSFQDERALLVFGRLVRSRAAGKARHHKRDRHKARQRGRDAGPCEIEQGEVASGRGDKLAVGDEIGRRSDLRADAAEKRGEGHRHEGARRCDAGGGADAVDDGKHQRQRPDIVHEDGNGRCDHAQHGDGGAFAQPGRYDAGGQPVEQRHPGKDLDDEQDFDDGDHGGVGEAGKDFAGRHQAEREAQPKPRQRHQFHAPAVHREHDEHAAEKDEDGDLIETHMRPSMLS